ncbi:MAG: C-GCAxxG-C-C family (seleno)protein [Promethearchaeota archaeon]
MPEKDKDCNNLPDKTLNFEDILLKTRKFMHGYTCAEAALQGLLDLWNIPKEKLSWATAGYLGAIETGKTTCGLLIGACCAIGFRCSQDKNGPPQDHERTRKRAVVAVRRLYKAFLKNFKSVECKTLSKCDFSKSDDVAKYLQERRWRSTCDIYLQFVLSRCNEMALKGKI